MHTFWHVTLCVCGCCEFFVALCCVLQDMGKQGLKGEPIAGAAQMGNPGDGLLQPLLDSLYRSLDNSMSHVLYGMVGWILKFGVVCHVWPQRLPQCVVCEPMGGQSIAGVQHDL